jgi:hypothetical protein
MTVFSAFPDPAGFPADVRSGPSSNRETRA